MATKSLLDSFFNEQEPKKYKSKAATDFFAANGDMRKVKAREALNTFEKLPEGVRIAIFTRAKIDQKRVIEMSPLERIKLLSAAQKITDDLEMKAALARKAYSAMMLLVNFKGDRERV